MTAVAGSTSSLGALRLYSYWRSSCAWRVRAALAHKGLAHELVPVNILPAKSEQLTDAYRAVNPMGQVPVLELQDGRRLAQSMAIIELLDEVVPEPALLPRDPWARATARMLAEIVVSGTHPLQNLGIIKVLKEAGADDQGYVRSVIGKGLTALETAARGTAGRFLVGDAVSIADLCLVPQLYNARRFQLPLDAFPTLTAVEARCLDLPTFQESHPSRQPDAAPQP